MGHCFPIIEANDGVCFNQSPGFVPIHASNNCSVTVTQKNFNKTIIFIHLNDYSNKALIAKEDIGQVEWHRTI